MESETSRGADRRAASQEAPAIPQDTFSASGVQRLSNGPATDAEAVAINRSSWIQEDESIKSVLYMSATGKHAVVSKTSIPLYPPNRFRSIHPFRSAIVLFLVVALIIVIPIGVVLADRATSNFHIPGIPGASSTTTPAATITPFSNLTPTTPAKK